MLEKIILLKTKKYSKIKSQKKRQKEKKLVAEVIINSSAKKLNRTFDYNIPEEYQDMVFVGTKVLVPFGKMKNLEEAHVVKIKEKIGIKKTIKDYVPDEKDFLDRLDAMCEQAFDDQCTGANPRYPLISEIKDMYLRAYYGK